MKICEKCGKEIPEGVDSCVNCNSATKQSSQSNAPKKLHCPNCKSTNITITTESSVTGGLTTHHGGISSTHMSNTHRNFWICSDCGTKFRNIQNLEEELKRCKNTPKIFAVLSILGAIISIVLLNQVTSSAFGFIQYPFLIGAVVATIVFIIFTFKYKKDLKNMKAELEYLKTNCFD